MKNTFPGYFKLREEEISALWEKALFVFDANVILNLYRYSETTRAQFLTIFERLKKRIWLPHHAVQEYLDNRLEAIGSQEKACDDAIKSLNAIEEIFKNPIQPPFISEGSLKKLSECFVIVIKELEKSKGAHARDILEDGILNQLSNLFSGCIGSCFSSADITGICKDGETRYRDKIPPGFKDTAKVDDGKNVRKYGDLIIWKEILRKAKGAKCDILLITDDKKEDWWLRFKGKTVGPHPELIKEFQSETGQRFHMYQSDRFLEYAGGYLRLAKGDVKPAIDELKSIKKQEADRQIRLNRGILDEEKVRALLIELRDRRALLIEKAAISLKKRNMLMSEQQYIADKIKMKPPSEITGSEFDNMTNLHRQHDIIDQEAQRLHMELHKIESEIAQLEHRFERLDATWDDFDQRAGMQ